MDIFDQITQQAESLHEDDVVHLSASVVTALQSKIQRLAYIAYSNSTDVARTAFKEHARVTSIKAIKTFIDKKHYVAGRSLKAYVISSLNRLAYAKQAESASAQKYLALICPGCKSISSFCKEILTKDGNLWRCTSCQNNIVQIEKELQNSGLTEEYRQQLSARLAVHRAFLTHSRSGYRCPEFECERFIPASLNTKYGIACPYTNCGYFGDASSLASMAHPGSFIRRYASSLDAAIEGDDGEKRSLHNVIPSTDIDPDSILSISQQIQKEYDTLMSVVNGQMLSIRNSNIAIKQQKLLMYEAFKLITEAMPTDMVSYLVHLKLSSEYDIQTIIFQKYIELVQNSLPFFIRKRHENVEIFSISDPDLGLFVGKSEFESVVNDKNIIPNRTKEVYIGGREFKNYGQFYIGKLINVTLNSGESVMDKVKGYSFTQIQTTLPPNTPVHVSHFRIHPHHEIGTLCILQRVRRSIVDKVYFRLHGKERPVQRKRNEL